MPVKTYVSGHLFTKTLQWKQKIESAANCKPQTYSFLQADQLADFARVGNRECLPFPFFVSSSCCLF